MRTEAPEEGFRRKSLEIESGDKYTGCATLSPRKLVSLVASVDIAKGAMVALGSVFPSSSFLESEFLVSRFEGRSDLEFLPEI